MTVAAATTTMTDEAAYRRAEAALWDHHGVAPVESRVRLGTLDTDVRVVEVGTGTPVLFLHGSPTAGANWAPLVGALLAPPGTASAGPTASGPAGRAAGGVDDLAAPGGVRCLVPDLPPGGLTGPYRVTSDTAAGFVRHLVTDLLDALDVGRAHLVASSSGSLFALHAASTAPDRIRRVVHLGAPWLVDGMPRAPVDRLLLLPGVAALLGRVRPTRRLQQRMIADIGHRTSIETGRIHRTYWDWTDALVHRTDTFRQQTTLAPALRGRGMRYSEAVVAGADVLDAQPPSLVVWGADETLATVDDGRRFAARLPSGRFELVDDAGHLPWLDHPARVADSVAPFLQET